MAIFNHFCVNDIMHIIPNLPSSLIPGVYGSTLISPLNKEVKHSGLIKLGLTDVHILHLENFLYFPEPITKRDKI